MKKILLLLILCITSSQIDQIFGMEKDPRELESFVGQQGITSKFPLFEELFPELGLEVEVNASLMELPLEWNSLPIELKAIVLEQHMTDSISNRKFQDLRNLRLVNIQINVILGYLFTKNDTKWINNLVDRINNREANPISKFALTKILLDEIQFKQFIENNNIDLSKANEFGQQLICRVRVRQANLLNELRILIDAGADLDLQDYEDMTALMYAAQAEYADVVQILIAAGANLNIRDDDLGQTALMYAAEYGRADIVKMLIAAGVNLNLQDDYGRTAYDYAVQSHNREIQKMLIPNSSSCIIS